jgi:hypothetical protein
MSAEETSGPLILVQPHYLLLHNLTISILYYVFGRRYHPLVPIIGGFRDRISNASLAVPYI